MRLFFDTSALLKRYIEESGSQELEELCGEAKDIAVSLLYPIEAMSTLARLVREKKMTPSDMRKIRKALFEDIKDITIISVTPSSTALSIRAIDQVPLKALDATHIGCAMEYQPDWFVSSDKQQLEAARKVGLQVKPL